MVDICILLNVDDSTYLLVWMISSFYRLYWINWMNYYKLQVYFVGYWRPKFGFVFIVLTTNWLVVICYNWRLKKFWSQNVTIGDQTFLVAECNNWRPNFLVVECDNWRPNFLVGKISLFATKMFWRQKN